MREPRKEPIHLSVTNFDPLLQAAYKRLREAQASVDRLNKEREVTGLQVVFDHFKGRYPLESLAAGWCGCNASPSGNCAYDEISDPGHEECLFCGEDEDPDD